MKAVSDILLRKEYSGLGTVATAPSTDALGFADHDNSDYHDLYGGKEYYQRQKLTAEQREAMDYYAIPDPEPASAAPSADGLHSPSQDLNWALSQGIQMSATQQEMYNRLMSAMHNTGYNINLTRYDHAGFVNALLQGVGVYGNAENMSVAELRNALVGLKYGENKFVSGSANNFANALGSESKWNKAVFMQRFVKITYKVDADVQSVMPGNYSKTDPKSGKVNRLHEQIMAPSKAGKPNYEIIDVKESGAKAHPKGSGINQNMYLNQIELVIRVRKQ